jgi:hypothetical protein
MEREDLPVDKKRISAYIEEVEKRFIPCDAGKFDRAGHKNVAEFIDIAIQRSMLNS